LPNGRWGLTLKAVVSIDKLTSFVEAKGGTVEIKGGLFALNIKQQLLNEQGEIKAVAEMIGLLHEPMQTAFDYSIKSGEPKSIDAESKNWEIPLEVTAKSNKNIDFCANYFIKTLTAISLTADEVASYKSLNKQVFTVRVDYDSAYFFYLRKQTSINIIKTFLSNWYFYTGNFAVQSGIDESLDNGAASLHRFDRSSDYGYTFVSFFIRGKVAGTFVRNDKRTLSQIEQMTGYAVKPRGVVSNFKNGGFVVWEKDGHGLVAATCDLGIFNWTDAKNACEELVMNGYSDWYLPTKDDLENLYTKLHAFGIGGFASAYDFLPNEMSKYYWSSTEVPFYGYQAWYLSFTGGQSYCNHIKASLKKVRAVRTF
jgi:hypothetical protein